MMADTLRSRSSRRRLLVVMVVIVALLAPGAVLASHQFSDVPDTSIFHDDIDWLADSGVTKGCNPPSNDLFCPDDNVTRGQMAAFMHRFAQFLGAEDGVVSEADHATAADSATNADNADTLQGHQAAELTTDAWGTSSDHANIPLACSVDPTRPCSDDPVWVASLIDLPAGSYVAFAKAHMSSLGQGDSLCELVAEDTVDQTRVTTYQDYQPTSFMLFHTFEEDGGIVELRCLWFGSNWRGSSISDIKITAISVDTLTEWPLDANS